MKTLQLPLHLNVMERSSNFDAISFEVNCSVCRNSETIQIIIIFIFNSFHFILDTNRILTFSRTFSKLPTLSQSQTSLSAFKLPFELMYVEGFLGDAISESNRVKILK